MVSEDGGEERGGHTILKGGPQVRLRIRIPDPSSSFWPQPKPAQPRIWLGASALTWHSASQTFQDRGRETLSLPPLACAGDRLGSRTHKAQRSRSAATTALRSSGPGSMWRETNGVRRPQGVRQPWRELERSCLMSVKLRLNRARERS